MTMIATANAAARIEMVPPNHIATLAFPVTTWRQKAVKPCDSARARWQQWRHPEPEAFRRRSQERMGPHRVVILGLRIQPGSPRRVHAPPVRVHQSHVDFAPTERVSQQYFEQLPRGEKNADMRAADEKIFRCFFNGRRTNRYPGPPFQ